MKDREQLHNEFAEWLKNKGKSSYGLQDIYINDNGKMKIEKRMATIIQIDFNDWFDFCKETGKSCESIKLIAFTI